MWTGKTDQIVQMLRLIWHFAVYMSSWRFCYALSHLSFQLHLWKPTAVMHLWKPTAVTAVMHLKKPTAVMHFWKLTAVMHLQKPTAVMHLWKATVVMHLQKTNCSHAFAKTNCSHWQKLLSWVCFLKALEGWVRVLRPFNSISVISRRWKGEHERLCAMKRRLGLGRISPPAGFEPATPWSEVGSANHSATRRLFLKASCLYKGNAICVSKPILLFNPTQNSCRHQKISWQSLLWASPKRLMIKKHLDQVMQKHVLCHMRTTKAQNSLHIRAVWSAPLLFAA